MERTAKSEAQKYPRSMHHKSHKVAKLSLYECRHCLNKLPINLLVFSAFTLHDHEEAFKVRKTLHQFLPSGHFCQCHMCYEFINTQSKNAAEQSRSTKVINDRYNKYTLLPVIPLTLSCKVSNKLPLF